MWTVQYRLRNPLMFFKVWQYLKWVFEVHRKMQNYLHFSVYLNAHWLTLQYHSKTFYVYFIYMYFVSFAKSTKIIQFFLSSSTGEPYSRGKYTFSVLWSASLFKNTFPNTRNRVPDESFVWFPAPVCWLLGFQEERI